jgi:hypothetical protein
MISRVKVKPKVLVTLSIDELPTSLVWVEEAFVWKNDNSQGGILERRDATSPEEVRHGKVNGIFGFQDIGPLC